MTGLPQRTRRYQNHHFDSTRWDFFERRPSDIIVASSYKSGTTWMQAIVANLLFPDGVFPADPAVMSPWLDNRRTPLEVILERLAGQEHRRFLKTHLPLDAFPYDPIQKHVYVSRDPRDVFVSLWNHYSHHTDAYFEELNNVAARVGDPFPKPAGDLHWFWNQWITRGWFEDESDGWPYWSHLHNVQSWWNYRHLDNVLLVHFDDLLKDREAEVRRIAAFLEVDVPEEAWNGIVERVSFADMKRNADRYVPRAGAAWKGGSETFMNRGENGHWRTLLSEPELAQYDAACARALSPDCRSWLEGGRPG